MINPIYHISLQIITLIFKCFQGRIFFFFFRFFTIALSVSFPLLTQQPDSKLLQTSSSLLSPSQSTSTGNIQLGSLFATLTVCCTLLHYSPVILQHLMFHFCASAIRSSIMTFPDSMSCPSMT